VLGVITAANMWGIAEAARLFMVPTIAFIVAIFLVIIVGLFRAHPVTALSHTLPATTESVGVLLILKAFASGCSALTGVEAIANSVPQFRKPRARRAQHTEVALGVILGLMLLGLGELIRRWGALPQPGTTVLAQLTSGAIGHGILFYIIQLITLVLLALAANTSFGGLPVLAGLLARDNFLPHVFGLRADRRVFRYGVGFLAVAAAALLIVARGNTQALVPVFAVGVFVGFTLSQIGMVRHWYITRGPGFHRKAVINGVGALLTFAATVIELVSKFVEGAWLVAVLIPLLVLLFLSISRTYGRIGAELEIGKVPPPPVRQPSLVIVPVVGMSRLTSEGICTALSLGDDVVAVTVVYTDEVDDPAAVPDVSFRAEWEAWRPDVPLLTLHSEHRSLAKPIVHYLRSVEADDSYHRLVVLIPEVEPSKWWEWVLHNQRGIILERAIRRGTNNVVLCRLRYRLATLTAPVTQSVPPASSAAPAPPASAPSAQSRNSGISPGSGDT
jgi:hypothetical protein